MLGLFFLCRSCERTVAYSSFPLCQECESHLLPSPALCEKCAGPHESESTLCFSSERDPWAARTYTARYLLVEPGYSVLRSWKKHGGPVFDRKILKDDACFLDDLKLKTVNAQAVVAIPQGFARSWSLGRSPAEVFARWVARELSLPLKSDVLRIREGFTRISRQAELQVEERLKARHGFEVASRPPEKLVLVDDFMTSGRTLRAAARALSEAGAKEIHVVVLGFRPKTVA